MKWFLFRGNFVYFKWILDFDKNFIRIKISVNLSRYRNGYDIESSNPNIFSLLMNFDRIIVYTFSRVTHNNIDSKVDFSLPSLKHQMSATENAIHNFYHELFVTMKMMEREIAELPNQLFSFTAFHLFHSAISFIRLSKILVKYQRFRFRDFIISSLKLKPNFSLLCFGWHSVCEFTFELPHMNVLISSFQ